MTVSSAVLISSTSATFEPSLTAACQVTSRGPQRGVTFIEIAMVLVIVAILAVVAMPAYQDGVRQARRVDAMDTLLELSSRQERFYAQNGTYTTEISGAAGLGFGSTSSPDGYYTVTAAACATGTIATCYTMSAAPAGDQVNDLTCATMTLDSRGGKTASGTDGPNCW